MAADSVDFWIDGVYWGGTSLRNNDGTDPLITTSALAAVGFISTSGATEIDYAVDNIKVTAMDAPESIVPPSFPSDEPETFEKYTAGTTPLATTVVAAGTEDSFIQVVSNTVNTAGSGNGVQLKDDDNVAGTALEYEFAPQSAVKVSFDFSPVELGSEANASFAFGIGQAGALMSSTSRRYANFLMMKDGRLRIVWDENNFFTSPVAVGSSNNLTMYANDYDVQSVNYVAAWTASPAPGPGTDDPAPEIRPALKKQRRVANRCVILRIFFLADAF